MKEMCVEHILHVTKRIPFVLEITLLGFFLHNKFPHELNTFYNSLCQLLANPYMCIRMTFYGRHDSRGSKRFSLITMAEHFST